MKKLRLLLGVMFFFVCICMATLHVNLTVNQTMDNQMVLHNIDALTQGEVGDGYCYGDGDLDCDGKLYRARVNW